MQDIRIKLRGDLPDEPEVVGEAQPERREGGEITEKISRARAMDCSRGKAPAPTSTPMWSTPIPHKAAASSALETS
jgi:hypothetical protein